MNENNKFQTLVNNSFLFKLYLLKRLPLAFIAGIAVYKLTSEQSITTVKYKWLTQNPFHSMYFACLAMAAEMSTGLLLLNGVYKSQPAISMLIVKNKAAYYKKAIGKIKFTCDNGLTVLETVKKVKESTDSFIIDLTTTGIDETGDIVASFVFTWSLKAKTRKV
jgi:hypothetical protein